jgi:hypothetical protein
VGYAALDNPVFYKEGVLAVVNPTTNHNKIDEWIIYWIGVWIVILESQ